MGEQREVILGIMKIKIRFDGDTPGLAEHKLSLFHFGEPLLHIAKGMRGTASGLIMNALGPEHGAKGGTLAKNATHIDVLLSDIEKGCAIPCMEVSWDPPAGANEDLFENLDVRVAKSFFSALKSEAEGERVSWWARQVLESLPADAQVRQFSLYDDDELIDEFEYSPDNMEEVD